MNTIRHGQNVVISLLKVDGENINEIEFIIVILIVYIIFNVSSIKLNILLKESISNSL